MKFALRYAIGWLTIAFAVCVQPASAQSSLASRVLVVYAANDPDSTAVANYYQTKRTIPNANMCAITLADPAAAHISESDYLNSIKTPVRNCLTTAGTQNILYILLAYMRPLVLDTTTGTGQYAIDSFLADIWDQYTTQAFNPAPTASHRYFAETQSQGEVYIPFQPLADYRAAGRYALIYAVWRLDGATPAIAKGLVDKALAAEAAGGPISQVAGSPPNMCLDMVVDATLFPDSGFHAADWDLLRVSQALTATNAFGVITDTSESTFGTSPAPSCPNTGLYSGWYNPNVYNDAFSWDTGAIGWDLDSYAMNDPRQGPAWSPNALLKGITATSGPVTEPYLEGVARPALVRDLLQGANIGDAFLRHTRWLKWQVVNVGDPLYQPFPNKVPPFNAPVAVNSLALTQRQAVAGFLPVGGTVTVSAPAPSGGLTVNLSANNPAVTLPPSVTIPFGQSSATFVVTTSAVPTPVDVILTAATPSASIQNTLTVFTMVGVVGFSRSTLKGGGTTIGIVALNASAPMGGATIQLVSDKPNIAPVPASVVIPAGVSRVGFVISTSTVSANTIVNITATYAGGSTSGLLTVTP